MRAFAEADLPALTDLWVAAWSATEFAIDFEARRSWLVSRLGALRAGGDMIVVGLDGGGRPAGFVTINPKGGRLDQLCVAPAERGSGLASALLDEAKRLSPGAVELEVNEANPRARRFYEREGFSGRRTWLQSRFGAADAEMRWQGARIARVAAADCVGCPCRLSRLSP